MPESTRCICGRIYDMFEIDTATVTATYPGCTTWRVPYATALPMTVSSTAGPLCGIALR